MFLPILEYILNTYKLKPTLTEKNYVVIAIVIKL